MLNYQRVYLDLPTQNEDWMRVYNLYLSTWKGNFIAILVVDGDLTSNNWDLLMSNDLWLKKMGLDP
jgi:hypothetical protein